MKERFSGYINQLQDRITSKLEEIDGTSRFQIDDWNRPGGGGGQSRIIENGNVFEKGGVNVSNVFGELPDSMKSYLKVEHEHFFACGISLVIHPKNPMVPTVHANFRYFELYDDNQTIVDQWFGGGLDLTPYYLFNEDVVNFHQQCKSVCDAHDPSFYQTFKKKCDDYFWNTHRNEARGVGGLFFDYCRANNERTIEQWYDFVTNTGDAFLACYTPIVEKRKDLPFNAEQRQWQELRRGRYVEFNLIHDKGTLFGLKTNGRIESILMSLPPTVQWKYKATPTPNSEEERLVRILQHPKDWLKH